MHTSYYNISYIKHFRTYIAINKSIYKSQVIINLAIIAIIFKDKGFISIQYLNL